ncbi:MAG: response regulator [Myxococcales bacterium]|nr:response regulator [Myxococcales bacterium]
MSRSILVVEDHPDNRKLVCWYLEDAGYSFEAVETGEEALAVLEQRSFGLVLMDISLPGIDGKETTRRLRANLRFKDLPILAVTAHAVSGEAEDILNSGVNGLITKPILEEELLEAIATWIGSDS